MSAVLGIDVSKNQLDVVFQGDRHADGEAQAPVLTVPA